MLHKDDLVLFQGDSITDAGRLRDKVEPNAGLGTGYAHLVAAALLADLSSLNLRFLNRGVSGDRITNLLARWKADCINLNPTVVSILIGINDIWHEFGTRTGTSLDRYERFYGEILVDTKAALPEARIVLCEPFVTRCGVVADQWIPVLDRQRAIVAGLAESHGATFVPFQKIFAEASREAPPAYWAADGVHPTAAGHMRMARAWIDAVQG